LAKDSSEEGPSQALVIKTWHFEEPLHPRILEEFAAQTNALKEFGHPNVVKIFDLIIQPQDCAAVMEYVPGKDIAEVQERLRGLGKRLTPGLAVGILLQVLDAYQTMMGEKVAKHYSPSDVRASYEGQVKIMWGDSLRPGYCVEREGVLTESKLLSHCGLLFYWLLAGKPIPNTTTGRDDSRLGKEVSLGSTIPQSYSHIVSKLLCNEANQRYQRVPELLHDLAPLSSADLLPLKNLFHELFAEEIALQDKP